MKIAILGTRGIPNNYGGFEQCAESLSVGLVAKGHEVTVYNPDFHPYTKNDFNGVKIKHIHSPQNFLGTAGSNFVFDYLCLNDALSSSYDIILELGLITAAPSIIFCRKRKNIIVTNLDGLEWKRAKWNPFIRFITKSLERFGVYFSDFIISDNTAIQKYILDQYNKESEFIAYGARKVDNPQRSLITKYLKKEGDYVLTIARLEPENNLELMCDAFINSKSKIPYYIIGNHATSYGEFLKNKYEGTEIYFLGAIFNKEELDAFRSFSLFYLHGHSVGGTNPALIEAMSSQSFIICHNNEFNKSVLQEGGLYFNNAESLTAILDNKESIKKRSACVKFSLKRIDENYRWHIIVDKYEKYFLKILDNK